LAKRPTYPFQANAKQLEEHIGEYVTETVASLSSFYLELPRRDDFLEYEPFKRAYEELCAATERFKNLDRHTIHEAVKGNGLILVVLRSIAGLSPPDLGDFAQEVSGTAVKQGTARRLDAETRRGRNPLASARVHAETRAQILALVDAACEAIEKGPQKASPFIVHRLDKVDTAHGLVSVQKAATEGIEYPMLLYERMLGRPFATYRDSVSSQVGDVVEDAVKEVLDTAKVSYYKTARAEAFEDFDQAPDFMIPSKADARILIEAKLTQDDGTARDKITRVQHLDRLSDGGKKFQVIACVDGRGFRYRPSGMRKLLLATKGKVFTLETMPYLIEQTGLRDFAEVRMGKVGKSSP
jgi:hypothetical protein